MSKGWLQDLEERVRTARERLIALVSMPRAASSLPLHDEPELRELARELPALESELARWARSAAGAPGGSPR